MPSNDPKSRAAHAEPTDINGPQTFLPLAPCVSARIAQPDSNSDTGAPPLTTRFKPRARSLHNRGSSTTARGPLLNVLISCTGDNTVDNPGKTGVQL